MNLTSGFHVLTLMKILIVILNENGNMNHDVIYWFELAVVEVGCFGSSEETGLLVAVDLYSRVYSIVCLMLVSG